MAGRNRDRVEDPVSRLTSVAPTIPEDERVRIGPGLEDEAETALAEFETEWAETMGGDDGD